MRTRTIAGAAVGGAVGLAVGLGALRLAQQKRLERIWADLAVPGQPLSFAEKMTADVAEPARRYLLHAIDPGTPLARAVELDMAGSIRTRAGAPWSPFSARERIATGRGFAWRVQVGLPGRLWVSGADYYLAGEGRSQFRLFGLLPVASAGGPQIARSAAGRALLESVWLPSALLPLSGARWQTLDEHRAAVRLSLDAVSATLTFTIDELGRPRKVQMLRTRGNGHAATLAPFWAKVDEETHFDGYTVPARIRAGWGLEGEDEFEFFRAQITDARYFQ